MTPLVWTYAAYVAISGLITVWFGRTLHHHGRPLLIDTFHGNTRMADAANHMLLAGFYVVNVAFVMLSLRVRQPVNDLQEGVELLSSKLGVILVVLGVWHFKNLLVCHYVRDYWKKPVQPARSAPLFD